MITDKEEKYQTDIDSSGRFTLRFPVLNSHNIFIDWGRTTIWSVVEPGETYFLYIDYAERKNYSWERMHEYSMNFSHMKSLTNTLTIKKEKMSNLDYLRKTQEIIRHKAEFRRKCFKIITTFCQIPLLHRTGNPL